MIETLIHAIGYAMFYVAAPILAVLGIRQSWREWKRQNQFDKYPRKDNHA
jgi:hypothetical protein